MNKLFYDWQQVQNFKIRLSEDDDLIYASMRIDIIDGRDYPAAGDMVTLDSDAEPTQRVIVLSKHVTDVTRYFNDDVYFFTVFGIVERIERSGLEIRP